MITTKMRPCQRTRANSSSRSGGGVPTCLPRVEACTPTSTSKNSSTNKDAPRSCPLLLRLRVRNLVDEQAHATLRDDVRSTVAHLDADHSLRGRDAQHGEEVHYGVGAPADHSHQLGRLDLVLHNPVGLLLSGLAQADQQLLDDVKEEGHGDEPADPARRQVPM